VRLTLALIQGLPVTSSFFFYAALSLHGACSHEVCAIDTVITTSRTVASATNVSGILKFGRTELRAYATLNQSPALARCYSEM